jgi:protein involved in polysaccharide export with SLBB domain
MGFKSFAILSFSVILTALTAPLANGQSTVSETTGRTQIAKLSGGARIVETARTESAPASRASEVVEAEIIEEENSIVSLYTSYLSEYRLGPSDIITVEVFGQCPDYCRTGVTVPPTARISYPLIRDGVFVGGKTVQEVADEVSEQLKDYIIDPKVMVSLDKPMSNKFSVIGRVGNPGVKVMDRRINIIDAINEAGGITQEGSRKNVMLVRFDEQGALVREKVDIDAILKGRSDMVFLNSGDQVYVPGKAFRFNVDTLFRTFERVAFVRYFFGIP